MMLQGKRWPIVAKKRSSESKEVHVDDFELAQGTGEDVWVSGMDPLQTLYAIDWETGSVLLVEASDPVGVLVKRHPFFYSAQYEAATHVILISLAKFCEGLGFGHHGLDGMRDGNHRLVLVHSVGRCGSTLITRAFEAAKDPQVLAFSEPDVFTQVASSVLAGIMDETEAVRLLASVLRWFSLQADGRYCVLKLRSLEILELAMRASPGSRHIVVIRPLEPWLLSWVRVLAVARDIPVDEFDWFDSASSYHARISRYHHLLISEKPTEHNVIQFWSRRWLSLMTSFRLALNDSELIRTTQSRIYLTSYEALMMKPKEGMVRLFSFCGLRSWDPATLNNVITEDSQKGTGLSSLRQSWDTHRESNALTEKVRAEIGQVLQDSDDIMKAMLDGARFGCN